MRFLKRVKNIEHHIRRANNIQDFTTSPLSFACTFNQSWKIKNLYFCSSVFHQSRYACQSRECKCTCLRFDACSCDIRLDLPTEKRPTRATLASPDFFTSNPGARHPRFSLGLLFTLFESSNLSLQLPNALESPCCISSWKSSSRA